MCCTLKNALKPNSWKLVAMCERATFKLESGINTYLHRTFLESGRLNHLQWLLEHVEGVQKKAWSMKRTIRFSYLLALDGASSSVLLSVANTDTKSYSAL